MLEIGPGHGSLARAAVAAGWRYRGVEASRVLADQLTREGLDIVQAWTPPIPAGDASADVVYADQVLEHMSGIDAAREFVAEARRILRSEGRAVCRRARLLEGAPVLLGHRLHPQLHHDRAARAAAALRRRLRHYARRAEHRCRDGSGARRPGRGRASGEHAGAGRPVALHRAQRTCSSASARICSKRSRLWRTKRTKSFTF